MNIHAKYEQADLSTGNPLSFKLAAGEEGVIEGYASRFGIKDFGNDIVQKGAFAETLKSGRSIPMLFGHDPLQPIGVWSELAEDQIGLRAKGKIDLEVQRGREVHSLIKNGALSGLSIGYDPVDKAMHNGHRLLKTLDLWEVSVVTFPMLEGARIDAAKSVSSRTEFERLLRKSGFPRSAASKLAGGGWSALNGASPDETEIKSLADRIEHATREIMEI